MIDVRVLNEARAAAGAVACGEWDALSDVLCESVWDRSGSLLALHLAAIAGRLARAEALRAGCVGAEVEPFACALIREASSCIVAA